MSNRRFIFQETLHLEVVTLLTESLLVYDRGNRLDG